MLEFWGKFWNGYFISPVNNSQNQCKMNYENLTDTQLKLYGIDRVIAVLKHATITQEQLSKWNRKQLKTSIVQSEMDFNFSFIKKQLKRELTESNVSSDRTLIISDDPLVISKLKDRKLAMILGLNKHQQDRKMLYQSGADVVVDSLKAINIVQGNTSSISFTQTLPSAFHELSMILSKLGDMKPLFFFDYDGTLAPINREPEKAFIAKLTRLLLGQLSEKFHVAIVSGRDMKDLKNFIGLESLMYAGSHGFRISGPGDMKKIHKDTNDLLPKLDALMDQLSNEAELKIKGLEIERKHLAIAVHYRNAARGSYKMVSQTIKKIIEPYGNFKTGRGKKVIEIRPSVDWHKGKAVEWITNTLQKSDHQTYMPIYLGDDITDEDAFKSLPEHGIGILVGSHGRPTAAQCQLEDVGEVQKLLNYLVVISDEIREPAIASI